MLTKKILSLLLILLLAFVMVSCWKKAKEHKNANNNFNTGYKSKAFWGEALEKGKKVISIYDWIDIKASQNPNIIK